MSFYPGGVALLWGAVALALLAGCGARQATGAPTPTKPSAAQQAQPTAAQQAGPSATQQARPSATQQAQPDAAQQAVWVYFTRAGEGVRLRHHRVARPIEGKQNSEERLWTALLALLAGPTAQEQAQGLTSPFSARTAGMLKRVTLADDGTAHVDFADFSRIIPNASTSAGSLMLLGQLNNTVFQFAEVETVLYHFNGSCEAFWGWLQGACTPVERGAWRQHRH